MIRLIIILSQVSDTNTVVGKNIHCNRDCCTQIYFIQCDILIPTVFYKGIRVKYNVIMYFRASVLLTLHYFMTLAF